MTMIHAKPMPNRRLYMDALRRMSPQERLEKAFELSRLTQDALRAGIEHRHPDATPEQLGRLLIERIERCRNRSC